MKKYIAPELTVEKLYTNEIIAAKFVQRSAERLGGPGGGGGWDVTSGGGNNDSWITGWASDINNLSSGS